MKMQKFIKQTELQASPEEVFAFHEQPQAIMQLMPPWERTEAIQFPDNLKVGARTVLKTYLGPFSQTWEAEHTQYVANRLFVDVQRKGPFAHWEHRHRFEPTGKGTMMIDEVIYALPFGWLGNLLVGAFVKAKLEKVFDYRHKVLEERFNKTESPGE
jgi:ligand-binding SRPBCC domain-containing protein